MNEGDGERTRKRDGAGGVTHEKREGVGVLLSSGAKKKKRKKEKRRVRVERRVPLFVCYFHF